MASSDLTVSRKSRPRWTLVTACVGYAMVIVDTTAVNVGLPAIRGDLGGSVAGLQWVIDAYVVVFASVLLLAGVAGDIFGSDILFRGGVLVFTAASASCALAPTLAVLIAARLCQGVGAAMLAPACLALIAQAYPDIRTRAQAVAVFVTAAGSPQAFGPILGGALIGVSGWRAIFWINVPLGIATLTLTAVRRLPHAPNKSAGSIPLLGHFMLFVALIGVTSFVIETPRSGLASASAVAAALAALVAGGGVVLHQRRNPHPAVARALLHSRPVVLFTSAGFLLFGAYYGLSFVLTLYLQQHERLSPFGTGTAFLASAIPIFALPLMSNPLVERVGARRVLIVGILTALVGSVAFVFGAAASAGPREIALLFLGTGVGLSVGPQIALVLNNTPSDATNQASGLINAARQMGTVMGVAVLGAFTVNIAATAAAAVLFAAICAVAALTRHRAGRDAAETQMRANGKTNDG